MNSISEDRESCFQNSVSGSKRTVKNLRVQHNFIDGKAYAHEKIEHWRKLEQCKGPSKSFGNDTFYEISGFYFNHDR